MLAATLGAVATIVGTALPARAATVEETETARVQRAFPSPLDTDDSEIRDEFAIGLASTAGPAYSGASHFGLSVSPAARLTWRGYSISTQSVSRATAKSSDTREGNETGVTGPMVRRNRFGFGYGIALNRGRSIGAEDRALGLKPLPTTLFGRIRMRYYIDERVTLTATLVGDILGRQRSVELPIGVGWTTYLGPDTSLTLDGGINFTNRAGIENNYGIGPAEQAASGLPLYRPKGGLREYAGSVTLINEPSPSWVWMLRFSLVRLTGSAAASPLVHEKWQPSLMAGFAYRIRFD